MVDARPYGTGTGSDLLRGTDLDANAEIEVTISGVSEEDLTNQQMVTERKLVLHFERATRGLKLSKTNVDQLVKALGSETDNWHGVSGVVYVEQTGMGPGVRFRVGPPVADSMDQRMEYRVPHREEPEQAEEYDDGIPF